jgi:hypothetical protein
MTPTKKPSKAKPKAAAKKPAGARPARTPRPADAGTKPSPRGEAERRRAAPAAPAPRPKEKEPRKAKPPARKEAPARRPAGRATVATGDARTRLGTKHACFKCGAKFYDLNKPEPVCPKCGADQRERPKLETKPKQPAGAGARRPVTRPMVPLLEEEEDEDVLVDEELDLGLEGVEEGPDDFLEEEEPEEEEPNES